MFYSKKPGQDRPGDKIQVVPAKAWRPVLIRKAVALRIPVLSGADVIVGMYLNVKGPAGTQVDVRFVREKTSDETGLQSYTVGENGTLFVTHWHTLGNPACSIRAEIRASRPVEIGTRYLKGRGL